MESHAISENFCDVLTEDLNDISMSSKCIKLTQDIIADVRRSPARATYHYGRFQRSIQYLYVSETIMSNPMDLDGKDKGGEESQPEASGSNNEASNEMKIPDPRYGGFPSFSQLLANIQAEASKNPALSQKEKDLSERHKRDAMLVALAKKRDLIKDKTPVGGYRLLQSLEDPEAHVDQVVAETEAELTEGALVAMLHRFQDFNDGKLKNMHCQINDVRGDVTRLNENVNQFKTETTKKINNLEDGLAYLTIHMGEKFPGTLVAPEENMEDAAIHGDLTHLADPLPEVKRNLALTVHRHKYFLNEEAGKKIEMNGKKDEKFEFKELSDMADRDKALYTCELFSKMVVLGKVTRSIWTENNLNNQLDFTSEGTTFFPAVKAVATFLEKVMKMPRKNTLTKGGKKVFGIEKAIKNLVYINYHYNRQHDNI